jgi:hypothetical protein
MMSRMEEVAEQYLEEGGDVIRIWPYADAPIMFAGLASTTEDIKCIVAFPTRMLETEGDWLGELLYGGYIGPDCHEFGDYSVYVVYN